MAESDKTEARLGAIEAQLDELRQQFAGNMRANVALFRAILETMQKIAAASTDPQIQQIAIGLTRMLAEMPEI